jgi:hypothetical protein
MALREDLEAQGREHATRLADQIVESSEDVDFRGGTFLLATLTAELGQIIQRRCQELARGGDGRWELAVAESESLINGAWRTMEIVSRLSDDFRTRSSE